MKGPSWPEAPCLGESHHVSESMSEKRPTVWELYLALLVVKETEAVKVVSWKDENGQESHEKMQGTLVVRFLQWAVDWVMFSRLMMPMGGRPPTEE